MSPAVPKPSACVKSARKPLKRSSPLKAGKPLAKSTKPLKKAGATKAKKVSRQKAYYASAMWKAKRKGALERAGRRCEYMNKRAESVGLLMLGIYTEVRCSQTEKLHVHHKTNARFGGDELDEDLIVYCKAHHDIVEARDFPHRRVNR